MSPEQLTKSSSFSGVQERQLQMATRGMSSAQ